MNEDLLKMSLEADAQNFVSGIDKAANALGTLNKGLQSVQTQIEKFDQLLNKVGHSITGFGVGIELSLAFAVKGASDFTDAMNNVFTIVERSSKAGKEMAGGILEISKNYGAGAKELAEAQYQIASSGVSADKAMKVLEVSTRASAAGLTTTSVSAKAITAALNAYGMSADNASYVSDILFQTVNLGVLSFEELATQMGDWIGLAAQAKVPLEDAAAAMAQMTLSGISAAESGTSVARVITSFLKPSQDMTAAVLKLGHASPAAMLATLGLRGSIEELNKTAKGSPTILSGIFQEADALKGVLALTAGEGKQYAKTWDLINDRTTVAGATSRAYGEQTKSLSASIKRLTSMMNALRIEMGNYLIPTVQFFVGILSTFVSAANALPKPLLAIFTYSSAIGGVLAILGGILFASAVKGMLFSRAMLMLNKVFKTDLFPSVSGMIPLIQHIITQWAASTKIGHGFAAALVAQGSALKGYATAAALAAVAVVAIIMGIGSYSMAMRGAAKEAKAFIETQDSLRESSVDWKGFSAGLDAYRKKIADLNGDLDAMTKMSDGFAPFRLLSAGIGMLTGNDKIHQTAEQIKILGEAYGLSAKQMETSQRNVLTLSKAMGVSYEYVEKLAKANGIDLTTSLIDADEAHRILNSTGKDTYRTNDKIAAAIILAAEAERTGAAAAGSLGQQYRQLKGLTYDQIESTIELTDKQKQLNQFLNDAGSATTHFSSHFADLDDAAQKAEKLAEDTKRHSEEMASASKDIESADRDRVDATNNLIDAQRELQAAQRDALPNSRAMIDATRAVTDAQEELDDAKRDALPTSREMVDADLRVEQSERDLAKAQKDSEKAQLDLTKAREDAAQALVDLEQGNRSAVLDQRSAERELRRAQAELANININPDPTDTTWKPPTADEIQEAQDAVARAQLRLEDANEAAVRAQQEFNEAQQNGVDKSPGVIAALEAVEAAKLNLSAADREAVRSVEDRATLHEAATERIKVAEEGLMRATEDRTKAQEDAALRVQESAKKVEDAQIRVRDAVEKAQEAAATYAEIAAGKIEEADDKKERSLKDYIAAMGGANRDASTAWQDYLWVVQNHGDKVAAELITMGDDGVKIMHLMRLGVHGEVLGMSDEATEESKLMAHRIRENMWLTGREATIALDISLSATALKAGEKGDQIRRALTDKLGLLPDDIKRISSTFGVDLLSGVDPLLKALNVQVVESVTKNPTWKEPTSGYQMGPDGWGYYSSWEIQNWTQGQHRVPGRVDRADGGFLPREATYQSPKHDLVQWAEPETEGEWFIPAAKSKRGRSTAILADVANQFGYQLTKYAAGGFRSAADVPEAPHGMYGGPLGSATDGFLGEVRDRTVGMVVLLRSLGFVDGGHRGPANKGSVWEVKYPKGWTWHGKNVLDPNKKRYGMSEYPDGFIHVSKIRKLLPWVREWNKTAYKYHPGGKGDETHLAAMGYSKKDGKPAVTTAPVTPTQAAPTSPGAGSGGQAQPKLPDYSNGVPWWLTGWNYQINDPTSPYWNPWQHWRPGDEWKPRIPGHPTEHVPPHEVPPGPPTESTNPPGPPGMSGGLLGGTTGPHYPPVNPYDPMAVHPRGYGYTWLTAPVPTQGTSSSSATAATNASAAAAAKPKLHHPPNMQEWEHKGLTYTPQPGFGGWWLDKRKDYRAWSLRDDSVAYWADKKHKAVNDPDPESASMAKTIMMFFSKGVKGAKTFDQGGTLEPGYNTVFNATGRPERLVPAKSGSGGDAIDYDKLARVIIKSVPPREIKVDARGVQNPYEMARRTSLLIGDDISSMGGL